MINVALFGNPNVGKTTIFNLLTGSNQYVGNWPGVTIEKKEGYLNKDILTNYSVTDDSKSISFNGKVLKEANINLEDINYTLRFTIHIVNNLNQTFAYNMKLDVNLDDNNGGIYNGYIYKSKSTSGNEYRFFREVN